MCLGQRGGFGQIRGASKQGQDGDEEENGTSSNPLAGLFGGGKKSKVSQEVEEEEDSSSQNPVRGLFGGGKKSKASSKVEEEEDSGPQNPLGGLFGGTRKIKVCSPCLPSTSYMLKQAHPQGPVLHC